MEQNENPKSRADADLLHRYRFEAELEGRGVGLEAEVVVLPIDEFGIGDEAVFVPAFGLPGGPWITIRGLRGRAGLEVW